MKHLQRMTKLTHLNESQVKFLFVVFTYIVYMQSIPRMYSNFNCHSQFLFTNADAQCGFQNSYCPAWLYGILQSGWHWAILLS